MAFGIKTAGQVINGYGRIIKSIAHDLPDEEFKTLESWLKAELKIESERRGLK